MSDDFFSFDLTPELDELDAFDASFGDDEAEQEGDYVPSTGKPEEQPAIAPVALGPEERIADLFDKMRTRKRILVGIIDYCTDTRTAADVNAFVAAQQAHDASVFTGASYCTILEDAGALRRVDENGTPYEEVLKGPDSQVEDGVEYLQPAKAPTVCFTATQEGLDAIAQFSPMEDLIDLLEREPQYHQIYHRVLTMTSAEGGATSASLSAAIDDDPIVQSPRMYSARFLEKLEHCCAIEWNGRTWQVCENGRNAMQMLDDEAAADEPATDVAAEQ